MNDKLRCLNVIDAATSALVTSAGALEVTYHLPSGTGRLVTRRVNDEVHLTLTDDRVRLHVRFPINGGVVRDVLARLSGDGRRQLEVALAGSTEITVIYHAVPGQVVDLEFEDGYLDVSSELGVEVTKLFEEAIDRRLGDA